MASAALAHAMSDPSDPPLRPLPARVCALLETLAASPRLAAHLRAVHDTAWELVRALEPHYPSLHCDREAVLFGAATHDIGKSVHDAELSGPGSAHEQTGYELLRSQGVEEHLARFARTHAAWTAPGVTVDDLLVSMADKVWKGKRVIDLEELVIGHLTAASGQEPWEAFLVLDDIAGRIAAGADARLAFQARHALPAPPSDRPR
ncbi:HDIG domain-containing metalloprotein [Actinomadura sp. HBU206391]|uniref:HDIG domain-containing metalloprotein n=1 Tax=Actinomadura sp. HBU206391 TaxID=2731692 RepID=UPI00164FD883|nr:HDIG domain-containing metalloprotein [Actinomadura sp. HBU206391]MBC6458114.1 HDIG domain-containing protein [Actinomadura sp. HBU206391]